MVHFILRQATGARAAAAVAALGLGGTLLFRSNPYDELKALLGGAPLPEETVTSPDRFADILGSLGPAGRESYLHFQLWDLLNPILIGIAGAMLLGWLLRRGYRSDSAWRFLVLLPVTLLVADLLENAVISIGIRAFPGRSIAGIALPLVTGVKFGAALATLLAIVLLAVLWLRDRISGGPERAA